MTHKISKFDVVYRSLLLSNFFSKGWGKPEDLKSIFEFRRKLARRDLAKTYVDPNHPITITLDKDKGDHRLLEGYFQSPFVNYLPNLLPKESEKAYFQAVLPVKQPSKGRLNPICVQYAGTGDHFFWRRRRLMALPLLKEKGVSSIIIEHPFYGLRKPKEQFRSCLQQVSDLFVMGACLILESLVLFHFCERENFCPIIAHGISMGGHMASLGATVWDKPIGLVPCLSWTSASLTFTKGVLTGSIPWDLLEKQYSSMNAYKDEVLRMIESEGNAHQAGKDFAQHMDLIAQIEEDKRSDFWHQVKRNVSSQDLEVLNSPKTTKEFKEKESVLSSPIVSNQEANLSNAQRLTDILSGKLSPKSSGKSMIPKILRSDGKDVSEVDGLHREAVHFMRGIMDECTHLKNYDVPYDPSLIYIVVAENDAYQPRDGIAGLPDIWPGANIKYLEGQGHVSSYLWKQAVFRQSIYDCIDNYVQKYMQQS